MTQRLDSSEIHALVDRLLVLGRETSWAEWKSSFSDLDHVGRYCSALANTAALEGMPYGVLVWGIDDTGKVIGTTFDHSQPVQGTTIPDLWLRNLLGESQGIEFYEISHEGQRLVVLVIQAAQQRPVKFKKVTYVRRGSSLRNAADDPELEKQLWDTLLSSAADEDVILDNLKREDVESLLEVEWLPDFMRVAGASPLEQFIENHLVNMLPSGRYGIPTATALVYARDLNQFPGLFKKHIRFLVYERNDRLRVSRDLSDTRGYAKSFESIFSQLQTLIPREERYFGARHLLVERFSETAVRESLGNAIIHQDLRIKGAGPIVEFFPDRIEICNPGLPLVEFSRLLDYPPRSRNERLAKLMQQLDLCEERGSGWDKLAAESARLLLPAPEVEPLDDQFRVTLLPHEELADMSKEKRTWSLYLHVAWRYVERQTTANTHVRERFGISQRNAATASRIIADAVNAGYIKPVNPQAARNRMEYIPFWA